MCKSYPLSPNPNSPPPPKPQVRHDRERRDDDMHAAMHAAMRPSALTAAARDVVVRAVEQGSRLVAAPKGVCVCM